MRKSGRARPGSTVYYAPEHPAIVGQAVLIVTVGETDRKQSLGNPETLQVLLRPPGTGYESRKRMYRVWSKRHDRLQIVGRMYADGKFHALKNAAAEAVMVAQDWAKALQSMREMILAHRIMST